MGWESVAQYWAGFYPCYEAVQLVLIGCEVPLAIPIMWDAARFSSLSAPIYHLHDKLMGNVISCHGMSYYTDNTQLYISIPGELSNDINVLSKCLEAAGI